MLSATREVSRALWDRDPNRCRSPRRRCRSSALAAVREVVLEFAPGDTVTVVSGPWKDAVGKVAAINEKKRTVTLPIDMFGRETPVEFEFTQVKKL